MNRYALARTLQLIGLMILPFGIAGELVEAVGLGKSMLISAGGCLVFYIGYLLQHGSKQA